MPYQRLPETVQTLYAELFEQAVHAQADAAGGGSQGTFVSKTVKGGTYWYAQRMEGDRKRQHYLGRESPVLLAWMERGPAGARPVGGGRGPAGEALQHADCRGSARRRALP